jgi:predicted nucleic acid-binding Zn ribbon protein
MIESALIEKVLRKHGLLEIYREQEPALLWEKIVGPWVARFAQPIWVHQGVLFVAVPNHIVQHEFSLLREEFKKKLNEALGGERVREIRFRVESFPKTSSVLSIDQIELTPAEEARDRRACG